MATNYKAREVTLRKTIRLNLKYAITRTRKTRARNSLKGYLNGGRQRKRA